VPGVGCLPAWLAGVHRAANVETQTLRPAAHPCHAHPFYAHACQAHPCHAHSSMFRQRVKVAMLTFALLLLLC
jgi:hypothetical protein